MPSATVESAARQSRVAIVAFLGIAKEWGLSDAQAAKLLNASERSIQRYRHGRPADLTGDQLEQI